MEAPGPGIGSDDHPGIGSDDHHAMTYMRRSSDADGLVGALAVSALFLSGSKPTCRTCLHGMVVRE